MEIKHTVEILTKDIQEIEKLVRNLNNSPTPPRIELDLALSKLRNVYELLSMIREDIEEIHAPEQEPIEQAVEAQAKQIEETVNQVDETAEEAEKLVTEQTAEQIPEEKAEQQAEPEIEPSIKAPTESVEQVKENVPEPEPVIEKPPVQAEIPLEDLPAEPLEKKKEAGILAEKFSNDPSINENIASATKNADVTSKIVGTPIDNIGRNIGINDRFLIIRELFEGDNDNYTQLITQLDSSADEQEAISLLKARFPNATDHEGYLLLAQLAKRKFISA